MISASVSRAADAAVRASIAFRRRHLSRPAATRLERTHTRRGDGADTRAGVSLMVTLTTSATALRADGHQGV